MVNVNDMSPLATALPEDIEKAKWCGDFARVNRLIAIRLSDEKTPECIKDRLRIEKEIIARLPLDYTYSEQEALEIMQKDMADFTRAEFDALMDASAIDWIYIEGKVRVSRKFYSTLIKVHPDIAVRAGRSDGGETKEMRLLNDTAAAMAKDGGATYHIRMRSTLKIADSAFEKGKRVLVHLPLPVDSMNMRGIKVLSYAPECGLVGDINQEQRTISFSGTFEENVPFWVEYEYDSVVCHTVPDPAKADAVQPDFDTHEQWPHIRFTPLLRNLCAELSGDEKNPVVLARRFYDYCTTKVTYSFVREYFTITQIPEYAASGLKGDCGVQALLFITLCRIAGIPARWQSGLFVSPYDCGCHDWAQFYVAPYGWLFADCSFGGAAYRAGNSVRHNHYFGNLDPFRMAANSVYQSPLLPAKTYLRADPYDNQTGEVEYEDRGLIWNEYDTTWDVLEMEKR